MTDKNKTLIVVLLDRSGSMGSIKSDMEGGFKTFVAEQAKLPGECLVSLYQFDDRYEAVYESKPIADVPALYLAPRGGTALLDATGKTIATVGEQLAKLPEEQRPGAVIFLIITDGQENQSREMKREQVKAMIKTQGETYRWQFVYLGADASTFAEAQSLGISTQSTAQYGATADGVQDMYSGTSRAVGAYRSAVFAGKSAPSLSIDLDDDADKQAAESV